MDKEEILDIINEDDVVIGQEKRSTIHSSGILHREIHVWLKDNTGNIIFQKRGLNKSSPGLLDATAGGHVDVGESYEDAAMREVKEETGLDISKDDLVLIKKLRKSTERPGNTNNFIRAVYLYKTPVDVSSLQVEESASLGFYGFSPESLRSMDKEGFSQFCTFVLEDEILSILDYFA